MGITALWNSFSLWVMQAGLPMVAAYHVFCLSGFFNVSAEDAVGVEKMANLCFAPAQYLFAGRVAIPCKAEDGTVIGYRLEQRFNYEDPSIWIKTAAAYCALPSTTIFGTVLKTISYLSSDVRKKQTELASSIKKGGAFFHSNNAYYASLGIEIIPFSEAEKISSLGYQRRPEDLHKLKIEKEALKDIVFLLNQKEIVYWLDCGSCLGAYRYGGVIPWDWDLDIAILQPDFDNVKEALSGLDPEKYMVQDWSSRDNPKTYLKVYVKEVNALIDIYHFAVDGEKKEVRSILSNGKSVFLPNSWKIWEGRYTIPTPFSYVFPLKKISFDGVDAYVPNKTEKYLQQRYGENIAPVKIYNPVTGNYEKDETHPYWQIQYVNTR